MPSLELASASRRWPTVVVTKQHSVSGGAQLRDCLDRAWDRLVGKPHDSVEIAKHRDGEVGQGGFGAIRMVHPYLVMLARQVPTCKGAPIRTVRRTALFRGPT